MANDVEKLKTKGKALYSCMLNEQGGIIDDLICYYLNDNDYRMVVNAATRENDLKWMMQQTSKFEVTLKERDDLSMLAIQGPYGRERLISLLPNAIKAACDDLKPFHSVAYQDQLIARTGYTGEDGFEVMLPHEQAITLWQSLIKQQVQPCGLGARDTLRLEAGLNLYGEDMDQTVTPYESNLGWTVSLEDTSRHFIGRSALQKQVDTGISKQLIGIVLLDKGVLRGHQKVITDAGEGITTSGTFSPTLGKAIAFARVPGYKDSQCMVDIRNRPLQAKMVKPPFVKLSTKE